MQKKITKYLLLIGLCLFSALAWASTSIDLMLFQNQYSSSYYFREYTKGKVWSQYIQWDESVQDTAAYQNRWTLYNRIKVGQYFSDTNYLSVEQQVRYDFVSNNWRYYTIGLYAFPLTGWETIEVGGGFYGKDYQVFPTIYTANKTQFEVPFKQIAEWLHIDSVVGDMIDGLTVRAKNTIILFYPIGDLPYVEMPSTVTIDVLKWINFNVTNVTTFDDGMLDTVNRAYISVEF